MMKLSVVKRRSNIVLFIIAIIFLTGVVLYFIHLNEKEHRIEAEIRRINTYFGGKLHIYKIPPWFGRAPVNTQVREIYNINYLLQTEEDTKRTITQIDGRTNSMLAGPPYYPFASRKEALSCYDKLTEDERPKYLVVSQSIVYIGHCTKEKKKILEEAVCYFDMINED